MLKPVMTWGKVRAAACVVYPVAHLLSFLVVPKTGSLNPSLWFTKTFRKLLKLLAFIALLLPLTLVAKKSLLLLRIYSVTQPSKKSNTLISCG